MSIQPEYFYAGILLLALLESFNRFAEDRPSQFHRWISQYSYDDLTDASGQIISTRQFQELIKPASDPIRSIAASEFAIKSHIIDFPNSFGFEIEFVSRLRREWPHKILEIHSLLSYDDDKHYGPYQIEDVRFRILRVSEGSQKIFKNCYIHYLLLEGDVHIHLVNTMVGVIRASERMKISSLIIEGGAIFRLEGAAFRNPEQIVGDVVISPSTRLSGSTRYFAEGFQMWADLRTALAKRGNTEAAGVLNGIELRLRREKKYWLSADVWIDYLYDKLSFYGNGIGRSLRVLSAILTVHFLVFAAEGMTIRGPVTAPIWPEVEEACSFKYVLQANVCFGPAFWLASEFLLNPLPALSTGRPYIPATPLLVLVHSLFRIAEMLQIFLIILCVRRKFRLPL